MKTIAQRIAETVGVAESQVTAAIELLDAGSTVPFIARYRKEVTAGLTDTHLRQIQERLEYLRDMDQRREAILKSLLEMDKLTPELKQAILAADTQTRMEDLYLPFRPKRRTKAGVAREAGLEPLAMQLLHHPETDPETAAIPYVNPELGVADPAAALDGAQHILIDHLGEDPDLVGRLRETVWNEGELVSRVAKGKETEGAKFSDYFAYSERLTTIPPHRILAVLRGVAEGMLRLSLELEQDAQRTGATYGHCEEIVARHFRIQQQKRPADAWLAETVRQSWRKKLRPHIDTSLVQRLTDMAHAEAIQVFARNLRDLLLAAPAGSVPVLGLDPGLRTGVKVAVVDGTGKVVATTTIHPHPPHNRWQESLKQLAELSRRHQVRLIGTGNGTASRETTRLVTELQKSHPELALTGVVVSEAGASVYSASEYASQELPELDVTLRGAVSIARRLQDPLAELVKIDPKAIGVGQYQHDVDPRQLATSLNGVVEDAVNAVGVDVNTASIPLLERVSGLNRTLARNIVTRRNAAGPFRNRMELQEVPRFGPKAFEQAAGFLRIHNGDTPLDNSAVHPESYPVVAQILKKTGLALPQLIGNHQVLQTLDPKIFVHGRFGEPTVRDILGELEKPGRDPRPEFRTATFREGVESLTDLQPGMLLEGTVTNVTNFGAFVDVGVHQDGLVHISAMARSFVKDPHAIVKAGDVIKVRVQEVDIPRRRIALSMILDDKTPQPTRTSPASTSPGTTLPRRPEGKSPPPRKPEVKQEEKGQGALAMALAQAQAMAQAKKQKR
ncbi:MAG: RNA-binding transcriptional accessory protein [Magnetococcus sp. DMHC-1]|nr:RNA-binding transcriptional accessory protein [Magnetococcales bacterium]